MPTADAAAGERPETGELEVAELRFEHRRDGLGIGDRRPRLSWVTATEAPGWMQSAYEVEVRAAAPAEGGDSESELLAVSGRVESCGSCFVPWPGPDLESRQRVRVRVRVWGNDGKVSPWSAAVPVEAGLLEPGDWTARFVGPVGDDGAREEPGPSPYLRREFEIAGPVQQARLYVTALGVYEVEINGTRVGDHVMAPGWSSYETRLRYETFDVTDLLAQGANAIGAVLGDGWFRGRLGFQNGRRNLFGDRLGLLAQLEIVGDRGERHLVVTDGSWRASTDGPLLASGIYEGEDYDARREQAGWSRPGFDDTGWGQVVGVDWEPDTLVARPGPPVRRTQDVTPAEITTSPSGKTVVDFGQNLVGRLRIRVSGPAGTKVTLGHAELLTRSSESTTGMQPTSTVARAAPQSGEQVHGELDPTSLRGAASIDRYTLRGEGIEEWEPRFTFHGFRYAEVSGWPGDLEADDITAVVCHSDMERTGWFECSDERVNQLHQNIVWGMRGNFLDVPTDCPQRDERLGWTGDLQVFSPTASFLYDCSGVLVSWLRDLAADQGDDGVVPVVVPNVHRFLDMRFPAAGWSDAAVVVPWVLYQRFGDLGVLEDQYPSMQAWVEHVVGLAGDRHLWSRGFQFGDWLDPTAPAANPYNGRTSGALVASAYLCRSLDLLADSAELLGKDDDVARYRATAQRVREAFAEEYVTATGRVVSDSQTAYVLALEFGLLPTEAQRERAARRLAVLVNKAGHRIATGFLGTPLICDALCATGNSDLAYKLLLQEECPSWLYPLSQGATTIWERWDSIRPDGTLNPDAMNSLNHYAYGAVGDWLHRTVAGLAPAEPGYRKLTIAPRPGEGLTWAHARHRTPYGLAESSWRIMGDRIEVSALVPPNTTATVVLPGGSSEPIEVGAGRHTWTTEHVDEQSAKAEYEGAGAT